MVDKYYAICYDVLRNKQGDDTMITKTKQDWSIGNSVRVGFLTLKVVAIVGHEYILESAKGIKYSFTPYNGLVRISERID